MSRYPFAITGSLLLSLVIGHSASRSLAQPPSDPFGNVGPAPNQDLAPPTKEDTGLAPDEQNPLVLAIFESNPTTPEDMMSAVRALIDIGRTDEAKFFIKRLQAANLDRDALTELNKQLGSAFYVRMMRDHRLEPEGKTLGKAILDAAFDASRDPAVLNKLIDQLRSPSVSARLSAADELRGAGLAALPPMVAVLADPNRAAEHARVRAVLADMGPDLIGPLAAVLDSPNDGLRVQIAEVLGRYRSPASVRALVGMLASPNSSPESRGAATSALKRAVGTVPTKYDVEQYLFRQATKFFDGKAFPGRVDYEDMIEVWTWDDAQKTVISMRIPAADAAMMEAAKLSAHLFDMAPDNFEYRRLFLAASLQFAKFLNGPDTPLPRGDGSAFMLAANAGVDDVEELLLYAVQGEHLLAAAGACEVLGEIGDESLLQSDSSHPRPLAEMLRHSDQRLRFAAADAVLKIDPKKSYAGSSFVLEALGYSIRTVGSQRALVGHPRIEQARTIVGLLNQLGYEADTASSGRALFRIATKNPDYEFVLISDAIDTPTANEAIQTFRRDPLTSRLPIGLMYRESNEKNAVELADVDRRALAFPRPHDIRSMAFQVARLQKLAGRGYVGFDTRIDNALAALDHLYRLAKSPREYHFYDLYRHQSALISALYTSPLSTKASLVLGELGSPQAQRSLVTLASRNDWPLEERQAAAVAFATAVERRGLLLTRDEILLQYDRYNKSETLDAETQRVLGSLLDAIEAPSQKQAQNSPAPQTD